MALTHVVDTSVLTRLGSPEVLRVVEPMAAAGTLARTSITDLEIGYSSRTSSEWDRVMRSLEIFDLIELSAGHFRRALQVQRLLAKRHQRGRKIPDLLLAAVAEQSGLKVLHYDRDFDRIAALTGQGAEWVVAAGSVD